MYFLIKILITAVIVAIVSEVARRYSLFAAAIASLPLTSILSMIWLYRDTHSVQKIVEHCHGIMWLIAPSLLFFIVLPWLLHVGVRFYPALALSCLTMSAGYGLFIVARKLVLG